MPYFPENKIHRSNKLDKSIIKEAVKNEVTKTPKKKVTLYSVEVRFADSMPPDTYLFWWHTRGKGKSLFIISDEQLPKFEEALKKQGRRIAEIKELPRDPERFFSELRHLYINDLAVKKVEGNKVILIVDPGAIGKLIGRQGKNIRPIKRFLGKDIEIHRAQYLQKQDDFYEILNKEGRTLSFSNRDAIPVDKINESDIYKSTLGKRMFFTDEAVIKKHLTRKYSKYNEFLKKIGKKYDQILYDVFGNEWPSLVLYKNKDGEINLYAYAKWVDHVAEIPELKKIEPELKKILLNTLHEKNVSLNNNEYAVFSIYPSMIVFDEVNRGPVTILSEDYVKERARDM